MLKSAGDLVEFFETTLLELERITETDYNQIFLVISNDYSRQLVAVADAIPPQKQRYRIATFSGLLGAAFSSGKTINAKDVQERPNYFRAVIETKSELITPISDADNIVSGVFNSESEQRFYFNKKLQETVELLASAFGQLLPMYNWNSNWPIEEVPWVRRLPSNYDQQ